MNGQDEDFDQSYADYRRARADAQWRSFLDEERAASGPPPGAEGQIAPGVERPGQIPKPLGEPKQPGTSQPPGPALGPEKILPAAGQAGAAVARQPAAVAKGVGKAALGLPKETLQALEDVANLIQGSKTSVVEKNVPGPGPSPEGMEASIRSVANFGLAFLLSSGVGTTLLRGVTKGPKLAALIQSIAGPGGASFITKQGGVSEKLVEVAADQLPENIKAPLAELLGSDPDTPTAVARFKASVANVADVKTIGILLGVASAARRALKGGK